MEIYGARVLRAAVGLGDGEYKHMLLMRSSGVAEVVIPSGGSNLVKQVLSQFAIQTLVGRPNLLPAAEQPAKMKTELSTEITENING